METLPRDGLNESWRVVCSSGAFHVKRFSGRRTTDEVSASLVIGEDVRPLIATPALVFTRGGDSVTCHGSACYAVTEWVESFSAESDPRILTMGDRLGALIATLHGFLLDDTGRFKYLSAPAVPDGPAPSNDAANGSLQMRHVRRTLQRVNEQLVAAPGNYDCVAPLFGDLWLGSVLVGRPRSTLWLVDWEFAGIEGCLSEELASFFFRSFLESDGSFDLAGPGASCALEYQARMNLPPEIWERVWWNMLFGGYGHLLAHYDAFLRCEPRTLSRRWQLRMLSRARRLSWLGNGGVACLQAWGVRSLRRSL